MKWSELSTIAKWLIGGGFTMMITTVTAAGTVWSDYGWVTNSRYATEHEAHPTLDQIAGIQAILIEIKNAQQANQDQWECDEADEEISDKERAKKDASEDELIDINRDLEKLRERWKDLNCSRFTE